MSMYISIYIQNKFAHPHTHTQTRTRVHTHTGTHTHTHTHTRTHTLIHKLQRLDPSPNSFKCLILQP